MNWAHSKKYTTTAFNLVTFRKKSCRLNFASCCTSFSSFGSRTRMAARNGLQMTLISNNIWKEKLTLPQILNSKKSIWIQQYSSPAATCPWPWYTSFCLSTRTIVSHYCVCATTGWPPAPKTLLYDRDPHRKR